MATDLTLTLEDRPGELARAGEALGGAGIDILGFCAIAAAGEVHVLVEDAAAARSALDGAGVAVRSEREMVLVNVEQRPGELGRVSRAMADAGVNIELAYPHQRGLAFGVDDPARARRSI
ncbi:MAG TPA: amino acid-binding protein [Actinomycetota bacterium]|nr:amino acid-binding protein [Actinomycetota bacterium]